MSHRSPVAVASLLGLTLMLSACTPEADSEAEPAPETVTVTQTAEASAAGEDSSSEGSSDDASSESDGQPSSGSDEDQANEDQADERSEEADEAPEDDRMAQAPAVDGDGLTPRGNIPKQVGEEARLTASSGDQALKFTVTDIESGFQCTSSYAEGPENEQFVKVDITASTGSAADLEELFYSDYMMFNPYDWKFVDGSGQTANEIGTFATYTCLEDSESLPDEIGPGENVSGSLILDVTDESGTLIYEPVYDSAGWEWSV